MDTTFHLGFLYLVGIALGAVLAYHTIKLKAAKFDRQIIHHAKRIILYTLLFFVYGIIFLETVL